MKVITTSFRCDLCGRFETLGVTEKSPDTGRETQVCVHCIDLAKGLLATFEPGEDPSKGGRWHG